MKIDFLGIPVDALTMQETLGKIDQAIKNDQKINHVVINAGKVVAMQKDRDLFNSVISCDIINADGQSIVWAARFMGKKIPERVAGIDLMINLLELAKNNNYKCFFFGAKEEVINKVIITIEKKFGKEIIAGYRNGYFSKMEEKSVAEQIAKSNAHILFVAFSSPKKENFLFKYRGVLQDINFTMGVGGSFDVIAGVVKRAPVWMQKIGMEWIYRFLQEPMRMWRRYLIGNIIFLWLVITKGLKNTWKCNKQKEKNFSK